MTTEHTEEGGQTFRSECLDYVRNCLSEIIPGMGLGNFLVADPVEVHPFRVAQNSMVIPKSYWHVPIKDSQGRRILGFVDCRKENPNSWILLRYAPPVQEAEKATHDILEFPLSEVSDRVQAINRSVAAGATPELVYDKAETRVAWKCELEGGGVAMITPNYTYLVDENDIRNLSSTE